MLTLDGKEAARCKGNLVHTTNESRLALHHARASRIRIRTGRTGGMAWHGMAWHGMAAIDALQRNLQLATKQRHAQILHKHIIAAARCATCALGGGLPARPAGAAAARAAAWTNLCGQSTL